MIRFSCHSCKVQHLVNNIWMFIYDATCLYIIQLIDICVWSMHVDNKMGRIVEKLCHNELKSKIKSQTSSCVVV